MNLNSVRLEKIPQYIFCLLKEVGFEKPKRERLEPIVGGAIYFQTLAAAVEFGLFDLLEINGSLSSVEIQKHLNLSPYSARVLLLGIATLNLVSSKKGRYYNSAIASKFLVSGSKNSMVNIIRWQNHINYKPMAHLTDSLKAEQNLGLQEFPGTEATLYERLAREPKLELIFQKAMEEISNQANSYLSEYVDFGQSKMIMDIGGGTGRNLLQIASKFPNTNGFVFDLPSVCQLAIKNFDSKNLGHRFTAVPGNCFRDRYPNNPDTIILCHFMTIWSEKENETLIQRAYDALPEKGRLIIFNMISKDSGDGPLTAAIGSPYFIALATGRGMLYSPSDYKRWFKKSGFRHLDIIPLPFDHRVFVAKK